MHRRRSKRPRIDTGDSHRDEIPQFEERSFHVVYERETQFCRISNYIRPVPVALEIQHDEHLWQTAASWLPLDDPEYALDSTGEWYDEVVESDVMQEVVIPQKAPLRKKKRTEVSRRPNLVWKNLHRATYLDEMARWAGRGDFLALDECPDCISRQVPDKGQAEYRCDECFQPDLVCSSCCVKRHRIQPFHSIKKWDGLQFTKVSLKSLGLRIQLNHNSMRCSNPLPCHSNMVVLHVNGMHEVAIDFCDCSQALPQHIQLLRRRLYPASQLYVRTCATFELLDTLHKFSLTTKASTYDFYRALEKKTNNDGISAPKSRYRALYRIILQWRHLKLLKWAGRAHDPTGPDGTKPGELALRCPSCPYPDINLPAGWQDVPDRERYIYMVFLCMDANFRLKNQLVSNWSQDPGLGVGLAYMVPRKEYEEYVLSRANDTDISTCVGFQALAQANTRSSRGLRYTGVNGVFCGRSEMVLPNGVGNLHKGERYANMDLVFAFVLRLFVLRLLLISYDICCQWFVHLFQRMTDHWPDEFKISPGTHLIPAIPKLHEPMHTTANHQVYSLNYIPGVGASDLESPERFWAGHNALGNSTKTQGPGTRHDTLDDHFHFWNWQKYVGLGKTLMRKYKAALAQRNIQVEGHRGLTESLKEELVTTWENLCVAWEQDPYPKQKPNPFDIEGTSLSEAEVRKQLAAEEKQRLRKGGISFHEISAHSFLELGLELEETQRRIQRLAKDTKEQATARQEGGLTEQRNQLRVRVKAWERLLPIYMPGLLQYRTQLAARQAKAKSVNIPPTPSASELAESEDDTFPENSQLWLPSSVPKESRAHVCVKNLPEMEERLRNAQCRGALDALRHILKLKTRLVAFKNKNLRGQREGTRSRAVIDRVHDRARAAATKYRAARQAKLALAGAGEWEREFRVLEDKDIRGYQDPDHLQPRPGRRGTLEDNHPASQPDGREVSDVADTDADGSGISLIVEDRSRRDGTGETRRTLSWIWTSGARQGSPEDATDEIFRAEWAKSRARANRSKEEVILLREEMRRVLGFLEWKAQWWREQSSRRSVGSDLAEGLLAYATSQANLQDSLAQHFREIWKQPLDDGATDPPSSNEPRTDVLPTTESSQAQMQDEDEDEDGGGLSDVSEYFEACGDEDDEDDEDN